MNQVYRLTQIITYQLIILTKVIFFIKNIINIKKSIYL